MPPKPQKPSTSKKVDEKKKQKIVEDKTFGMKNKKGAKAQKFIQNLQKQVQNNNPNLKQQAKKKEEDDLKDMTKIFKPVPTAPKLDADVDPKSVLCVFFKQGLCTKGNKCKFSHDLSVQAKAAKRNLYFDSRDKKKDGEAEENAETNENWDERQLIEVAEKKHGEKDRKRPNQTDIVCKYFIEAVEINKYGWFWECPNGDTCIYRHALPPGYVLSKDRKKMDEQNKLDQISLEELIEEERAKLQSKEAITKVTLESFIAWKKRKIREKRIKAAKEEAAKRSNFKHGRQVGLSGKDLFTFNPDLFGGEDDEEANDIEYEKEQEEGEEDEVKAFEIDEKTFLDVDDMLGDLSISSDSEPEDESANTKDASTPIDSQLEGDDYDQESDASSDGEDEGEEESKPAAPKP